MARERHQAAYQALARHGIDAAHSEVDTHQLELLASAHGWHWSVEPLGRQRGTIRYQAMVWAPTQYHAGSVSTLSCRGQGATEATALAIALGNMLAHQERHASSPDAPTR